MSKRCIAIALLSVAHAAAWSSTAEFAYTWKSGDLFRYDYQKTVTITQPDDSGKPEERKTEFAGVLILEIRSVANGAASGTLRFDSPRISLPVLRTFNSQADAPELQPDKNRTIAKAMEGAIKAARWTVNLGNDGSIQITSRTPANLNDWLKEVGNSAGWRRKSTVAEQLTKLIEQDFGLKVQATDREIFACSGAAPAPSSTGAALHPVRADVVTSAKPNDKLLIAFKRQFPKVENTTFAVPSLIVPQDIKIKPQGVTSNESNAIFDAKLGMLDTLNEDYAIKMKYECGAEKIDQDVRVQYRLKRLAPAIARTE